MVIFSGWFKVFPIKVSRAKFAAGGVAGQVWDRAADAASRTVKAAQGVARNAA
jgi:hypothetical protein